MSIVIVAFESLPCRSPGTPFLYATSLAILKSCEKDLLRMQSLAEVLPYLQRLPVHKVNDIRVCQLSC